jgi:hypothetical protein
MLFDLQGRMLLQKSFPSEIEGGKRSDFYSIDISTFNAAIYLLQLETSNGTITKQLIKE